MSPILLDQWVRGHFHYRGENREVVRTPEYMWRDWQEKGFFEGDCDDVSVMFAALLACLGFRLIRFVAIRYDAQDPAFTHVFVEAYYAGSWRVFDQTVSPGTSHTIIERMVEAV